MPLELHKPPWQNIVFQGIKRRSKCASTCGSRSQKRESERRGKGKTTATEKRDPRAMYQTVSPPLFDIPDFPTLRRVKPLPKRRRTSLNFSSEVNVRNSTGIGSALVSKSNSYSSYISAYHPRPTQSSPSEVTRTSDVLPSAVDGQQSQYDWRLGPDFFLPEEILRVASVLPESRVVDGVSGDGEGDGEEPFLPLEPKPPPSISAPLMMPATPPPLPNISEYDEEAQKQAYRSSYFTSPTKQHINHEGLNLDEHLDPEMTEGELQDRFFLRTETDRLLAHADSLSAKMALRSYYHSMGYGEPEFDTSAGASPAPLTPVSSSGVSHVVANYATTQPNGVETLEGSVGANGVMNTAPSVDLLSGGGYVAVDVGRGRDEVDGDGRGGDYADNASQQGQGNTKKRKVPANVGSSPPHHHHHYSHHSSSSRGAYGNSGYEQAADSDSVNGEEFSFGSGFGLDLGVESLLEDPDSRTLINGVESDVFGPLPGHNGAQSQIEPPRQYPSLQSYRKPKLSPVAQAGLQRKELVKSRKKQLEAIMGDLPASDTLVLDHALSRNFPPLLSFPNSPPSNSPATDSDNGPPRVEPTFVRTGGKGDENFDVGWGWAGVDGKETRVRLSRRRRMRAARAVRVGLGRLGRHPDAVPFPTGEFTYSLASASECFCSFLFLWFSPSFGVASVFGGDGHLLTSLFPSLFMSFSFGITRVSCQATGRDATRGCKVAESVCYRVGETDL